MWTLASGGSTLNLSGPSGFLKEPCVISPAYNRLSPSSLLVKETRFTDRHTDWTCLAGEEMTMGSVPVYQYGSSEPASETEVVSRSFTSLTGETWIFLVWNRETYRGGKMYLCNGIPLYAKAAVIHSVKGDSTLYRLRF